MALPRDAADALARLELFGINFGLERTARLLAELGDPQRGLPAVLVAGTNGKGSVAATVEAIDREAGYRTGLYTSPHLEEVEERHPSFAETWFTPTEQARLVGADALTRAWAVKEAVLKALGTGMALSPRDVEVVALRETDAEVRLYGEAAARHAALGGAPLRVRLGTLHGRIVATALFAA